MNKQFGLAWKIWDILYPIMMYYVALMVPMYIAQLIFGAGIETYMLCKTIGSIVAIFVVFADYKRDLMLSGRWGMREDFSVLKLRHILMVIGISLCLSVALNNLLLMSPLVEASEEFENANQAFYGSTIYMELLGSALVTPILEELLHRGVVFGRLRYMMGKWAAVILSALIFAMLHFNIVQFIYAFLFGLVLALVMDKTRKLYLPILMHIAANALAVIRTETGFLDGMLDKSALAWISAVVLAIVGVVWLVVYLVRFDVDGSKES